MEGMALDLALIGALIGSILFLGFLVWLMVQQGSQEEWRRVSQQTRQARAAGERRAG